MCGSSVRPRPTTRASTRRYSGDWYGLADYDSTHPFFDRVEGSPDGVDYLSVDIAEGTEIDAWGQPSYGASNDASGYRAPARRTIETLVAEHVCRRSAGSDRPDRFPRWPIAGCVAGLALAAYAPFTYEGRVFARWGLLAFAACIHLLHTHASSIAPPRPPPRFLVLRSLLHVWFWSFLGLFAFVPWDRTIDAHGAQPFAAAAVVATAAWAAAATMRRSARIARARRALLSQDAADGVVRDEGGAFEVKTPAGTLAREDFASVWGEAGPAWMEYAAKAVVPFGIIASAGDHALVARVAQERPAWTLFRAYDDSARATLHRAWQWDRAMPIVYGVLAVAAAVLWWR